MSTLADRITQPAYPDLSEVGRYGTPAQMPLARVTINNDSTVLYEDTQTLWTADGAPIVATGKGTWGQLYAAGKS